MLTFKTAPYYNDYDEAKQFYNILFRPGYAVQTRELNQLQTYVEEQFRRFGNHLFADGAMVIPGQVTYDQNFQYVKINATYNSAAIQWDLIDPDVVGQVAIQGVTSGVTANVVMVGRTINTIYIKYSASGTDKTTKVFADNEVLKVVSSNTNFAQAIAASATGVTSAASIEEGVYFIKGRFLKVYGQTVRIADYDRDPTARVGLQVTDSIITPEDDSTLFDNANGSPNATAPGAHRYKIDLVLTVKTTGATDDQDFVELLRIKDGVIERIINRTIYTELEKTLARRTEDTNGSFAVRPFKVSVREHLNDENGNGGLYTAAQGGDATKLVLAVEPGKAYVQGHEIETIVTDFVPIDKARDTTYVSNNRTRSYLGNYIYIDRLFGVPTYDLMPQCTLYDAAIVTDGVAAGNSIGTATIRGLEFSEGTFGNVGQPGPIFKCYLSDISITGTNKTLMDVRSLAVSDGTLTVTANVLHQLDIVNVVGSFTDATITAGAVTETVRAWDTTNNYLLTLPPNGSVIPNNTPFTSSATGSAQIISRKALFETEDNILVYSLPQTSISTVRDKSNAISTTYAYRKVFTPVAEASGTVTFQVGANETFASVSATDYVATIETGSDAGKLINVSAASPVLESNLTQLTFNAPAGTTVKLSATVNKSLGSERTKTLQTATLTVSAPVPATISLAKCDCYRPVGIWTGTDDTGTSLNDRYVFDTGQRDNLYDFGTLTLKPGAIAPSGSVFIRFEYFSHGAGDYFTVNSYQSFGNHTDWYERIPYFVTSSGQTIFLRDVIDFRPRRDENNTSSISYPSSVNHLVKPNDDFICDYSYYLARIDKLYLDPKGNWNILKGTPSLTPVQPSDPNDGGMVISTIYLGPYTYGPKDTTIRLLDNKRYTMRMIGDLEKRIANLEYYTTLSLLEKETASYAIYDAQTGLDRFKQGFVVDAFTGTGVVDINNSDVKFSIDPINKVLRPMYNSEYLDMDFVESESSNLEYRTLKTANDLLTLPYTEEALIVQDKASRFVNLNPYNVFSYSGSVSLDPATDVWKDTERTPDILVTDTSVYDSISAIGSQTNAFGTVWNEWQTDWTGSKTEVLSEKQALSNPHTVPQPGNVATADGEWDGFMGIMRQTLTTDQIVRTTRTFGQSRKGITSTLVGIPKQTVDNKVVNVALAPYIRNKTLTFVATRLKPNTRHYAFFDEVAISSYCTPNGGSLGDALVSDANGSITGTFAIPAGVFKTGRRVFRLCDSSDNTATAVTSFADTQYNASGLIQTEQKTITSVIEPQVQKKDVSDSRVITTTSLEETKRVQWIDPLAQAILVNTLPGGYMLTAIGLYFQSKDASIPVTIQLRTMENGIPTQTVVPFSEVTLNPAQVNVSADASSETKFAFPSPVYLKTGVEYAVVAMSNSNNYNVWVATIGDLLLNTDKYISSVPYAGPLFKSQNASTWTPDQGSAMKFNAYRAKFNTAVTGRAYFNNAVVPTKSLPALSIQTFNGTNYIRIHDKYHGMPVGSLVTITIPAGTANANWSATWNGIPVADIVPTEEAAKRPSSQPSGVADTDLGSRTYVVSNSELHSYTIAILNSGGTASNANASGYTGVAFTATKNYSVDVMCPMGQELNFSGTQTAWYYRAVTGKSTHGSETPYQRDKTGVFPFTNMALNENVEFDAPRVVASQVNETNKINLGSDFDNKSLVFCVDLSSTVDNLSPMVYTKRSGVILIANAIDNRTTASVPASDPSSCAAPFTDELASTGSTGPMRYIQRPAQLADTSTALHVLIACMRPSEATVEVYYRTLPVDTYGRFEDQAWVKMNPESNTDFSASQSRNDFKDYYWSVDGLSKFSTFSIKVVMRSTNSCKVPYCKDFRAIALD